MNYLIPDRLDRLAREYVLGTLAGRARRRFERVLQQTPVAQGAVRAWQERLGALAVGVPAMQPREAVWQGLEQRLFTPSDSPRARQGSSPWQRLRELLAGRALAGALVGVLLCAVVLRLQPGLVGLELRSETLPESYVGLLLDGSGQPTLLASSRRHGRQLTVKVLRPVAVPSGQVAQLWALPNGGAPVPVAVLPPLPAKGSVSVALPDSSEKLFSNAARLGISLEPRARGPGEAPSHEFLVAGHCVKLW